MESFLVNVEHESNNQCVQLSNCTLSPESNGLHVSIGILRMITSVLSIIGAMSIVFSAIARRQVTSQKVHPIFMLSIADLLLALMWVIGGGIAINGSIKHRAVCFIITLFTVILECVTINLTLVYALYANAYMQKTNLNSIVNTLSRPDHGWPKLKVLTIYCMAWIIPALLVIVPFVSITVPNHIISDANKCSCWCLPKFANILPISSDRAQTNKSMEYILNVKKIGITSTTVIAAHYCIVFPLMIYFYVKILRHIKKIKEDNDRTQGSHFYGATGSLLVRGHSQAKQRIILFLSVFVLSGFFNLLLALILMIHLSVDIHDNKHDYLKKKSLKLSLHIVLFVQSVTVPLQGFLNAIVYGWTREDFLYVMASTARNEKINNNGSRTMVDDEESSDFEDSTVLTESENSIYRNDLPPSTPLSDNF